MGREPFTVEMEWWKVHERVARALVAGCVLTGSRTAGTRVTTGPHRTAVDVGTPFAVHVYVPRCRGRSYFFADANEAADRFVLLVGKREARWAARLVAPAAALPLPFPDGYDTRELPDVMAALLRGRALGAVVEGRFLMACPVSGHRAVLDIDEQCVLKGDVFDVAIAWLALVTRADADRALRAARHDARREAEDEADDLEECADCGGSTAEGTPCPHVCLASDEHIAA